MIYTNHVGKDGQPPKVEDVTIEKARVTVTFRKGKPFDKHVEKFNTAVALEQTFLHQKAAKQLQKMHQDVIEVSETSEDDEDQTTKGWEAGDHVQQYGCFTHYASLTDTKTKKVFKENMDFSLNDLEIHLIAVAVVTDQENKKRMVAVCHYNNKVRLISMTKVLQMTSFITSTTKKSHNIDNILKDYFKNSKNKKEWKQFTTLFKSSSTIISPPTISPVLKKTNTTKPTHISSLSEQLECKQQTQRSRQDRFMKRKAEEISTNLTKDETTGIQWIKMTDNMKNAFENCTYVHYL